MESIPKVASFYNLAIQAVSICVLDNAVYLNKENGCQTFICNRYFNGIMSFEKHLHVYFFSYCALHDQSYSNALHDVFKDASDNQIMMITFQSNYGWKKLEIWLRQSLTATAINYIKATTDDNQVRKKNQVRLCVVYIFLHSPILKTCKKKV